MKFFQTLRYKLFGGANEKTPVLLPPQKPCQLNPWEKVAPSDSEQLSPDAMRETYADYFLYLMHELLGFDNRIGLANFTDKITPDTIVKIQGPWNPYYDDRIVYKNGSIYMAGVYEVHISTFTPEQDKIIRTALLNFVRQYNPGQKYDRTYNIDSFYGSLNRFLGRDDKDAQKMVDLFMRYMNAWRQQTPLSKPELCDGCNRRCYLGQNKYIRNIVFEDFIRVETIPTINYYLADKFYDQTGALVSADKGVWPTQYLTAREIARRCPSYEKQR